MQFFITAYDATDNGALDRRLAARDEHLKLTDKLFREGKHLYAAAILDDNEKMIGSVIISEFASRTELDEYLKIEPYVKQNVWEKIDIKTCKVGPMFMELYKKN
ncbi:YciI family protein [Clostridium sp. CX1]|uniref:YciI family protein n=1 Tax=Clostridium tanneri TaxID=3037988 RepID=A0ABU4JR92_9CLOT|nr:MULTISPECIES: YciI family protein [unclassified Clostridium]MCT8977468.1 YciI family protein [Clostridium sp. CX1]MDW8800504.1 YciI family protein [Clostridium sp. A1-XYC3]